MAIQVDAKAKAIMLFSQLSNINYGYSAPSETELANNFNRILEDKDGKNVLIQKIKELWDCNWKMAWGPALNCSQNKGTIFNPLADKDKYRFHADNSVFVVKGFDNATKRNVYLVAIAGTNSFSLFEQEEEDIAVKTTVPWLLNNVHCGYMAKGSYTGFSKVFLEPFGQNTQSGTLQDFFVKEMETNAEKQVKMEIITCGHSLGGALSPLVALSLREWSKEKGYDIPISTYPTAGPTSGDENFAKYVAETLGEDNYISVINTNDIVPMAWEYDTFSNIKNTYDNETFNHIKLHYLDTKEAEILGFLSNYAKNTKDANYKRIAKDLPFQGQPEAATTTPNFMTEALYQHLNVYLTDGFGFDDCFAASVKDFINSNRKLPA